MDLHLSGKVAIVTGAGRGIGEQIAVSLASEGAAVVVNDLDVDRASAVVDRIKNDNGTARAVIADVTNRTAVDRMVTEVADAWGSVDILVNNAGIPVDANAQGSPFVEMPREDWDKVIGLNLYGCMNCSQAVIEHMMAQNSGKIISIMSEAGRIGEARMAPYSAAKAGILGFSKALARELARHGVNVNCISAAATFHDGLRTMLKDLGMTDEQIDAQQKSMYKGYPMARGLDRLGLPTDIADAVSFLASDRANWITGQVISVTGGFTMLG
jgi:2-hydroxycyclohexanecarboxyl-CoA dehydrogenase